MRKFSLIIPVYKNESSILDLLKFCDQLNLEMNNQLEVIFVNDGSPDNSALLLSENLIKCSYKSQLINLSRNFGAFNAIRAGLECGKGKYFAVMAADLQEPLTLIKKIFMELDTQEVDVCYGIRESRADSWLGKIFSYCFWMIYRKLCDKSLPPGGVDIFGCTERVRSILLNLKESHSSLIGQLFWVGFRRKGLSYVRNERHSGKSSWTFSKKMNYMMDSIFSFTDFPIRVFMFMGVITLIGSSFWAMLIIAEKFVGTITLPGYSSLILFLMLSLGINFIGLGMIGGYVWRAYENTKQRPLTFIQNTYLFNPEEKLFKNKEEWRKDFSNL